MNTKKTGVLLLNLGTPSAPSVKAVRKFLREFLSDRFVIDLPWLIRMFILYVFILPFRPRRTALAYQEIWTDKGSPLLFHSKNFAAKLSEKLGDNYSVALGMRYGEPSISAAVNDLKKNNCDKVIIMPLFPQYSSAATGSAIAAAKNKNKLPFKICKEFYADAAYQKSIAASIHREMNNFHADHVVFSYHGLPERHLTKAGCDVGKCDRINSCLSQNPNFAVCYRAQCFATTAAVATLLALENTQYTTVFQSRLGRVSWIRPYADVELSLLAQRGIKNLLVVCPSFVVDCLETLEEIGIRAKKQWQDLGGADFRIVPCLNDDIEWVNAAAEIISSA